MHILIQQLINGIILGSIYGLIAIGYTMVYGIIGMINFAHGEIYMISAYLLAIFIAFMATVGIQPLFIALMAAFFLTIIITGLYGVVLERVAYKPLRGSGRLAPLISAIGASLFLQNYVQIAQGPNDQTVRRYLEGVVRIGSEKDFFQMTYIQIVIVVVTFVSMLILSYVINKTSLGRLCRATQQDIMMANLLGINSNRIISVVFLIGAIMAAVAGILITFNFGSFNFFVGFIAGIKAFTAAVLGGIGSLPGAMLGGIVLGLSESLFAGFVNSDYKDVFAFSLLILVLVFRPTGFLGKPEVSKI